MAGDPEEWQVQHHPSAEEFQEDGAGIFLPRPTGKECRQLVFSSGMMLNVEESQHDLRQGVAELHEREGSAWLHVTDAQFGQEVSIPAGAVRDHLMWIAEAWIDVAAAREQLKQREMALRLQSSGIQAARGDVLPLARSNGKRR